MTYRLLPLALLLTSCPSPGLHTGPLGITSQQGYRMGTSQRCVLAERAVCLAEATISALIDLLPDQDLSDRVKGVLPELRKVSICLIDQPEPCRSGGYTLGPCDPSRPAVCARKAGCATTHTVVAARMWPPVCTPDWPSEPHCVGDADQQRDIGDRMVVHETVKMIGARLGWYGDRERPLVSVPEDAIADRASDLCRDL